MTNNAFGLIYTGEANARLRELTFSRSVAAVPFGGRYRVIDFLLSDMVNTGISNVGLITQRNYHSLMDHLGSGKEWDLHRKRDGLFILPPFVTKDNTGMYRGTVDAIRSVLGYVRRSTQKYVILTGSHTLYNTTYDAMLRQHIETGAEITIMYNVEREFNRADQFDDLRLTMDETCRVTDLSLDPYFPTSSFRGCDAYIMEKERLEYLVEEAASHGEYDFMRDVLVKNVDKCRIYGWRYDGYVARLDSVSTFYKHNMELLDPAIRMDLFNPRTPIYTKVKDEVPAKYTDTGRVRNSIVADGCIIEGEVENSVLFRGVVVGKGAVIKNSIVMQGTVIEDKAAVINAITDKDVTISKNRTITGSPDFPVYISKGGVV